MTHPRFFTRSRIAALAVSLLAISLSVPPLRSLIEQSMFWHMVVQMPLLVLAGWLTMSAWPRRSPLQFMTAWNVYGLNGFFITFLILAYWMLPSAIDRAVVLPQADALKLLTLFAAGALSKHALDRSPTVLQLFFVALTVSMLIWLGFYFVTTELRLCNAYSLASQVSAGWGLIGLGISTGGAWLLYAAVWRDQARSTS
jgi:hypothetical protein